MFRADHVKDLFDLASMSSNAGLPGSFANSEAELDPVLRCTPHMLFTTDPVIIREFRAFWEARQQSGATDEASTFNTLLLRHKCCLLITHGAGTAADLSDEEDDESSTAVTATQDVSTVRSRLDAGGDSAIQARKY